MLWDFERQVWPVVERFDPAVRYRLTQNRRIDRATTWDWWRDADEKRQADEARQAEELVKNERERKSFYGQHP